MNFHHDNRFPFLAPVLLIPPQILPVSAHPLVFLFRKGQGLLILGCNENNLCLEIVFGIIMDKMMDNLKQNPLLVTTFESEAHSGYPMEYWRLQSSCLYSIVFLYKSSENSLPNFMMHVLTPSLFLFLKCSMSRVDLFWDVAEKSNCSLMQRYPVMKQIIKIWIILDW